MNQKQAVGLAIAVLVVLVAYKVMWSGAPSPVRKGSQVSPLAPGMNPVTGKASRSQSAHPGLPGSAPVTGESLPAVENLGSVGMKTFATQVKDGFTKAAGLQLETPGGMNVRRIAIGEGLTAMVGMDRSAGTQLSVIGYNKVVPPQQVLNFATSGDTDIPNLDGVNRSTLKNPRTVPAVPGSGLGNATLLSGKNDKGEDVYLAFAPRQDQKGMYMVVMTGPNEYFENNDGLLEDLYLKMRATNLGK